MASKVAVAFVLGKEVRHRDLRLLFELVWCGRRRMISHARLPPIVAVALVLCSLVAQSVAKGGGGVSSGGYSSAAAGSGGKATGSWGRGGSTTAGGSAVVKNGEGAMSPRPRFYNGGSFTPRAPIFLAAGFGSGYLLSRGFYRDSSDSSGYRDCSPPEGGEGSYQYGRNCRKCSDWECPIGQYRQECTPDTDSYCKLCTNKPEEEGYVYTTPGNDNDCEYAKCTTDASSELPLCDGVVDQELQSEGFAADSAAEVVFYSEVPLDAQTFNAKGAAFKEAISEVAGGATVQITSVEAVPAEIFSGRRRSRVGVMHFEDSNLGTKSVLRQSKAPECSAPLPPQGQCDQKKCTSPDNSPGGNDCWAGNGEAYSCQEGYEYETTGATKDQWNEYTCCEAPMSVVVVETTVRRRRDLIKDISRGAMPPCLRIITLRLRASSVRKCTPLSMLPGQADASKP